MKQPTSRSSGRGTCQRNLSANLSVPNALQVFEALISGPRHSTQRYLQKEMKDITFELVTDEDLVNVTDISIKSFHSDIDVGAKILKGPPGYDSIDFHRKMLRESSCFYKVLSEQNLIGAFWFIKKEKDEAYLYRLFLEPSYHKKGIGLKIFQFLFHAFPEIKTWEIKTPKWNKRTRQFYKKIGFNISEETERFFFFKKVFN